MLFNSTNNPWQVFVYSLCGTLPENITDIYQTTDFVKAFPIPSNHQISFSVTPPNNLELFELVIFDSEFKVIKTNFIN